MTSNELKKDVEELTRLLQLSTRVNVRSFIQGRITELEPILLARQKEEAAQSTEQQNAATDSTPDTPTQSQPKLPTRKINSYAWDQSDAFVKIYATDLNGVSKIPSANVTCSFNQVGFNLLVSGLNGKNHQLQIVSLYSTILPDESKIKIKSDSVLIMLKKAKKEKWEGMTDVDRKKKEKQKEAAKPDASDDPQAGIMNMMKKMYDEGDDDMKRTIAKAWTESQEKKATGGDMSL